MLSFISGYFENMITGDQNLFSDTEIKDLIKAKAAKHSNYYRNLYSSETSDATSIQAQEMAPQDTIEPSEDKTTEQSSKQRQRRMGVFEIEKEGSSIFKSVTRLREDYLKKLEGTSKKLKEFKSKSLDDSFLQPPASGYCSSTSAASDDEREKIWSEVRRSGSSDSAVGHSDEEPEKKEVELPYKPVFSPYSPRSSIDHVNVPSKTLIEAQFVPMDRKFSDCGSECVTSESRRHSCFTDDGEETPHCRYFRTPSVVVSDYSDDVMGLTLEDIEYLRNQRRENSSPDSSLNSSCSNLNYCGSSLSNLDAEYILKQPFRKSSDCSTCSGLSGDEESDNTLPVPSKEQVSVSCLIIELICGSV